MNSKNLNRDDFRNELESSEQLKWSGRPRQGIFLEPTDFYMIPFSLMWGGFAFFWEYSVLIRLPSSGPGLIFPYFGIPFCLVGIYLVFGRFFYASYVRKNTFYGVTTKRVLIKKLLPWGTQLVTFDLFNLPQLTITTTKIGLTTIEFGQSVYGERSSLRPPRFEQIENGTEVKSLLRPN